jgi:hypothetical protein
MPSEHKHLDGHERFKELSALANSGTLSADEWRELKNHLQICQDCRQIHDQYQLLATVGMPFLAATYSHPQERDDWDHSQVWEKLAAEVGAAKPAPRSSYAHSSLFSAPSYLLRGFAGNQWVKGSLAAFLGIAVMFAAYGIGRHGRDGEKRLALSSQQHMQKLAAEKRSSDELIESQAAKISQVLEQNAREEEEVRRLRAGLRLLEDQSHDMGAAAGKTEEHLRTVSAQRENLTLQLQQAEQSNQSLKAELVSLRAAHDQTLLHTASLESRITELTAAGREQERRLGDDEKFLASDRDIRELMGARKLYIADVFDVDSGSRTRKPFGRIFYTQNKSLIFYAFDLDRQTGVKDASIFQVWGQKDGALGEKFHAMNLGILYMDSESNRRWVLRLDDSKELAEIDAVFVTVEPHVGNPKPTGKPFLYALLRKEANHP